ncbi:MAG: DUF4988 domain-containing protein [Pseudoflavonifractor sp.]|nr:DUF4988 domain-containing protein [Alloprevotella sp.]MCM1116908.1 DUF4988 domain-containing protein [Pseudoflavonifractor sp.]
MNRLLQLVLPVSMGLLLAGCNKYDDAPISNKLDDITQRVEVIEKATKTMNADVSSIMALLDAQKNHLTIVGVKHTLSGLVIMMDDGSSIVIRDGKDGKDGQDATPPADVITPLLKVDVFGCWVVSYDKGVTWTNIKDTNGYSVQAVFNGGGSSYVTDVYQDGDYYVFILSNGSEIRIRSCECTGGSGNTPVTVPDRVPDIIPSDILPEIEPWMPIYKGTTPPDVNGVYFADPFVTVYCEDQGNGGFDPGYVVTSEYLGFFNQNSTNLTIDFKQSTPNMSSYKIGDGCYIQGSDNKFTAFFNTEGQSKGIYTKTALLISGTKTANGIKDLYYAFVMVDKGNDPSNLLMKKGVFRVFKDSDGMAENAQFSFDFISRSNPAGLPDFYEFIKANN